MKGISRLKLCYIYILSVIWPFQSRFAELNYLYIFNFEGEVSELTSASLPLPSHLWTQSTQSEFWQECFPSMISFSLPCRLWDCTYLDNCFVGRTVDLSDIKWHLDRHSHTTDNLVHCVVVHLNFTYWCLK